MKSGDVGPQGLTRRAFLAAPPAAALAAAGLTIGAGTAPGGAALAAAPAEEKAASRPGALQLGLVTYNLAKDWDLETVIRNCTEAKFEAVELRTTHAHGVEVALTADQRREVRKRFADSPVALASLGSAFEFHSADPAEVRRNVEGAKEYARLAADVGAKGIKVRPNGLQTEKGIPEDTTLRQIGAALAEVGEAAGKAGIEVRVEVHGRGTSRLPNMRKLIDYSGHPNVFVCWNSNAEDLADGGFDANFALVKDRIRFVHLRDLFIEDYPFRRLFASLRAMGYAGYSCAEIPESKDPVRVMKYFRALFLAYQDLA
jgi:sugar phosphate isomerase/epimerase